MRIFITIMAFLLICCCLAALSHASMLTVTDHPYNAVGDGVHDDTAGLQRALHDGYAFLPCGSYRLTQALTMPTNSTLQGMGPCSVLVLDARLPQYAPFPAPVWFGLTNSDYVGGNGGLTVRDVTIDARAVNYGNTHSLHFRNTVDVLVEHVTTYGGGDGVALTHSRNWVVRQCHIHAASNAGLDSWDDNQGGVFEGNTIHGEGIGEIGILSTDGNGIKILGNTVRDTLSHGIWFQGLCATCRATDSQAIGNTMLGAMLMGIRTSEADGIIIAENVIEGAQWGIASFGEYVQGGTNGVIRGNILRNIAPYAAIVLGYGSTGWTIGGNVGIGGNTTLQIQGGAWPNLINYDNQLQIQWLW